MKKLLVLTGGGDCPGLNAVIRAIVKRAEQENDWQVFGSIEAFNGVLREPKEIIPLTNRTVSGIHVKGGTILQTTTKGGPFTWPVQNDDGSWTTEDRSDEMIDFLKKEGFEAVINIGGDGSQRISQALYEKGLNMIGVPKTIDNDLSSTDYTFGFQTAVEIATDGVDKLVTTAESHHRLMIMEVMGRNAGWIALHAAVAGGAEVCLIPEIPYDIDKLVKRLNQRYTAGKGFANIVIAEGAKPKDGTVVSRKSDETGYQNVRLGGVAYQLSEQLKAAGFKHDIREMVLGHLQRGGKPIAYDRVLATQFGVKAMEMAMASKFGEMVAYVDNEITSVPLKEATSIYNQVDPQSFLVQTARGVGISFGD
ncbi:6-phosphofructokinase [Gracilimonas mengyeensis]|uniref:ATP-dependent 6-phosphofructokinase n=1 Tax=Gracilimonas mengyeensis TaxID=1302730 RepID=A0A521FGZ3_9BACT|nr:ATP-dependent 6-phosphofructokinase [Gracilimonas mengyeensis]SMO95463.1 6-phosphofructokinase [Gracilimonas mengyeensis]